ncbi:MAG: peptide ABC transporter substrate-binding protein [Actinomycetota bacterium]|nr:peptide ABC transporter substrate-binding protein [Actinomycetota bacterium]
MFRVPIGEPRAIDPYNARESEGNNVTKRLFVGLVTYDGNAELDMRPGVAERWSTNDDCTQWTFNLRRSRFSNGEEVTAESFIRGWTRAADAKAASQVAYHLAGIQGYSELHGSPQTATTFSGLSAPDPHTLAVRLTSPDCEFDKKTLVSPMSPVPSVAGAADNRTYNEAPIGNGPFMFEPGTKWEHNQRISLVRNDSYYGARPNLDGVEYLIFPAQGSLDAQYRAFQAGEVDFSRIPPALIGQARSTYTPRGDLLRIERFGINYVLMNTAKGPLSSADARRAVSMALDREAISNAVYQGALTPASALVPPPFGAFHQSGVCGDACTYDPARAKDLAAGGGLMPGTRLKLAYNNDGGHEGLVQVWKQQLESNLGVVVELDGAPFGEHLAKRDQGDFDLARASWGADYPTVDSVLHPLLGSDSADNDGRYRNPEVDSLIQRARAQKDDAERRRLVNEAERIAIAGDVAVAPMWYRTQYRVFDSRKWTGVGLDFHENATLETVALKA